MSAAPHKLIKGADRRLGSRHRPGGPRPGHLEREAVLRRLDRLRRRAEQPRLAGRRRDAGHAAGDQRGMRRARRCAPGSASRPRSTCARCSTARTISIPTLPQGYQISQYKSPIVGEGEVVARTGRRRDASRSASSGCIWSRTPASRCTTSRPTMSYVDLNRSGVALMEIVSKPDIRSAEQAKAYVTKLRTILRYLGTCDGDMEKGSLRADVNVSVRRPGEPLGTRCEIKNVNSIRFIGQAIEHEARRQIDIIEDGGTIDQETRLFDPNQGETRSMRSKEEAHDYRYFPDPDLLPLEFTQGFVEAAEGGAAGTAGREEGALHRRPRPVALRRERAGGRARERRVLRGRAGRAFRPGARRQSSPPTGSSTSCSDGSTRKARRSGLAGVGGTARRPSST